MAFIYRYHIRNKKIRDNVNISKYSVDIVKTITEFYKNNLKDCRVVKDYYEYKLHFKVNNQTLREFGKKLQQNCQGLREVWQKNKKKNTPFFIRKEQEFYAFINKEENGVISNIELVDVIDFNDLERLDSQAAENLNRYLNRYNIKENPNKNTLTNAVIRAYYMDVFTADISGFNLKSFLKGVSTNKNIILIKGFHRRQHDKNKIIAELDVDQLRSWEISNVRNDVKPDSDLLVDGFEVAKTKELDSDEVERIKKLLNIYIESADTINESYKGTYSNINFTVYNVGQALSTSLSDLNDPPFLYFDFGVSEGPNLFNRPVYMTVNVDQLPSLVISHLHRDHWFGITVFTKSFECDWYIPDQHMEESFKKRCAEIIVSGGSVNYIKTPIPLSFGTIFTSQNSKHNPSRLPSHKHDSGLALRMKLQSKEKTDVNILVAGDLRYDYIPDQYLKEIDILIASHHGGEYSWSKRLNVCDDIPISSGLGLIVYSYGDRNTHHHPSHEDHYILRGWNNSHKTVINSDFKLK